MKHFKKYVFVCLLANLLTNGLIYAACSSEDSKHGDQHVTRCEYTQERLREAISRNKDRYPQHNCFYCGCAIDAHSAQQ